MKISVIMWDGSFRKFTHTIDCFSEQTFPKNEYEIIWVDFYNSSEIIRKKLDQYKNTKLFTLKNDNSENWNLGICINNGVKNSIGELLVIPDPDIFVEKNFLQIIWDEHKINKNLVLYIRRYDEPMDCASELSKTDIKYLKDNCILSNPTNYAGCLSVKKENYNLIGGFEEHKAFCESSMSGIETYTRFRNAGLEIKWATTLKVYHPWHPDTGKSNIEKEKREIFGLAKGFNHWIVPYAGIEQSWITHKRALNVDIKADKNRCELYLEDIPDINKEKYEMILKHYKENKEYIEELYMLKQYEQNSRNKIKKYENIINTKENIIKTNENIIKTNENTIKDKVKTIELIKKDNLKQKNLVEILQNNINKYKNDLNEKEKIKKEYEKISKKLIENKHNIKTLADRLNEKVVAYRQKTNLIKTYEKNLKEIYESRIWRIMQKIVRLRIYQIKLFNKLRFGKRDSYKTSNENSEHHETALLINQKNNIKLKKMYEEYDPSCTYVQKPISFESALDKVEFTSNGNKQKNCLIVGSGRSGTSMFAGILHDAKYYLGEKLHPPKDSNPKGFFECAEINGINEKILKNYDKPNNRLLNNNGEGYNVYRPSYCQRWLISIPRKVCIINNDNVIEERIKDFITTQPFAFKDPRFSYTLPVWQKYLTTDTIYICVFREPNITVESILKECNTRKYLNNFNITREEAYEVWLNIYSHILKNYFYYPENFLFVHYKQILSGKALNTISKKLGVELCYGFVEKKLNRTISNDPTPKKNIHIYKKLCNLAQFYE